jgi:AbrB family looped-hinge helix DNA binding protein
VVDRVVAIRDGRTSSEFIRKKSYAEELAEIDKMMTEQEKETHVELAVVDKAGRLQIPKDYLDALNLKGKDKLKVEMDGNRIVLLPPDMPENEEKVSAG